MAPTGERERQKPLLVIDGKLFDPEQRNFQISFVQSSREARRIKDGIVPGHQYVYNLTFTDKQWQLRLWVPEGAANPQEEMAMVIATPQGEVTVAGEAKRILYARMTRDVLQERGNL